MQTFLLIGLHIWSDLPSQEYQTGTECSIVVPKQTAYAHIWWSESEISHESTGSPPITEQRKMKIVMHSVFVSEDYELDLYNKFHGWKMTFPMPVREYTEEFQKMITCLRPTNFDKQKVHGYIKRMLQSIKDGLYFVHYHEEA